MFALSRPNLCLQYGASCWNTVNRLVATSVCWIVLIYNSLYESLRLRVKGTWSRTHRTHFLRFCWVHSQDPTMVNNVYTRPLLRGPLFFHNVLCTVLCEHNSHSKWVMQARRDLTWKKLDQKVESSGEYLLSSFHCECEQCPHWVQCCWGMREKQNDQQREDMQVFPEVLFQSIVVVVVVVELNC